MASLIDGLKLIPAPRKAQGKCHPFWFLLLLVIHR